MAAAPAADALSALVTWDAAQKLGGRALLRIEDIDQARCKPEFDAAILEDLHWLGLDWPEHVLRQSARFDLYADAAVDEAVATKKPSNYRTTREPVSLI